MAEGDRREGLDPKTQAALRETYRRVAARRSAADGRPLEKQRFRPVTGAIQRYWFALFLALTGAWVVLPWLAPVFMQIGWTDPARAIYFLYSFQCHQLPQRSFFVFGPQVMYSIEEIRAAWIDTTDPLILRTFIGNAQLGYKVAWSDRMVSAYTSIPLGGLIWALLPRRMASLPLWGLVLLAAPMAVDAGTHFLSDLAGVDQGFRFTNAWLAELTRHAFPAAFYAGNLLGSFNSWMRLLTGLMFGTGLAVFALPHLSTEFQE